MTLQGIPNGIFQFVGRRSRTSVPECLVQIVNTTMVDQIALGVEKWRPRE